MVNDPVKPRLVVGITGASGVIYGVKLLEALNALRIESHLVLSRAAEMTLGYETALKPADVRALATHSHAASDVGASIASGSFKTLGMIIAPCSIKTMAEIATGVTSNLMSRAADVTLKERRRLVLMVRETPLHTGHIKTMLALSEMGAVIAPPVPAFYAEPKTIDDLIAQSLGRVLDLFGLGLPETRRWGESVGPKRH